jgi:hypothetical protein
MEDAEKELLIEILRGLHYRIGHLEDETGAYEGSASEPQIERLEKLLAQKGTQRQCQA